MVYKNRLILLLLLAWAGLTIQIDVPWFGHHDGNGAWISASIRAYQLYGFEATKLIPSTSYTPPDNPDDLLFYTHHPPLIVWLSGLSAVGIGLNETALRFTVASLTLISIAAFYALVCRLLDERRALVAAAFYAFVPMTLYFGRMPNHEPLALAVGMLFAVVMVDWLHFRRHWLWLALLAVLAAWSMWGGVMLIGCLGIAGFMLGDTRQRREMVAIGAITVIAIAVLLLYYESVVPGAFAELLQSYTFRASETIGYGEVRPFTVSDFIRQQVFDLGLNLTLGVLLVSIYGLWRTVRTQTRLMIAITLALWGMAVIYILILRNAAFEHDFYKFFFVPPVALTAAVGVDALWKHRRARLVTIIAICASLLAGWLYVGYLHVLAADPRQPTIIESINTYAQPDDKVMANVRFISLGMAYYLARETTLDVVPEAAVAAAPVVYIYCPVDDLPAILQAYPREEDAYCAYIRIS